MPSQIRYMGNPVLNLQNMLRTISFQYPVIPKLIPNGVFGERTLEAVMVFQREFSPPVTGRVDNATWDTIVSLYHQVLEQLSQPLPCTGYPSEQYTILPGESCVHLYLIQSMFKGLSTILEEVVECPIDGTHTEPSVQNIKWIQKLNGSQETGIIDNCAWNMLSRLYTIFVTYAQSPWLTRQEVLSDSSPD